MGLENSAAADAVRAELQRIIASGQFDASPRNRRFLQYVVEETLADRAERIKGYSIATEVFGRDPSFDPQTDPVIRIEASRLRRSLERYYLTAGVHDPIRIDIPKGSYIPTFDHKTADIPPPTAAPPAEEAHPTSELSGAGVVTTSTRRRVTPMRGAILAAGLLGSLALAWFATTWVGPRSPPAPIGVTASHGPMIFVAPFDNDGGDTASDALVRGFTREVIVGLTRFEGLSVFGPETSFRYGASPDAHPSMPALPVDFRLSGGITSSRDRLRVAVALVDAATGRNLWSDTFEGELTAADIFQTRDAIAGRVVQALAQPYGVIFREEAEEIEGKPPASFTSYQCMLEFYNYWRDLSLSLHSTVQQCLERAVAQDPTYSEAYSALAMVYANVYRYGFNADVVSFDPLPKALELAHRAVELAPDSVQGYKALHLIYWLMHDVDRSFEAAEHGLALNPNDSEIMADLGGRLCLTGNWERGFPLVQEAFKRNPGQPGLYRIVTSLRFYLDGRYQEALDEIEKANIPSVIHYHVILAMAHAQLGQMQQAAVEVKEILKIDPAYGDDVLVDLQKHNVYPDLIRAVVAGLRKAGLKGGAIVADRAS
jgi:adenylate cyclase